MNWKLREKRRMKKKGFLNTKDLVLIAVFTTFICICAMIQIPSVPIPITLQTFGVFVTAGVLGTKKGTIAVFTYILLGAIGIPVFRGMGGIGVLTGPTGGYITGFLFTSLIVGFINQKIMSDKKWLDFTIKSASMIIGDMVCMFLGTLQFVYVAQTTWMAAVGYCVLPFIIPDLIKIVLAVMVTKQVRGKVHF